MHHFSVHRGLLLEYKYSDGAIVILFSEARTDSGKSEIDKEVVEKVSTRFPHFLYVMSASTQYSDCHHTCPFLFPIIAIVGHCVWHSFTIFIGF